MSREKTVVKSDAILEFDLTVLRASLECAKARSAVPTRSSPKRLDNLAASPANRRAGFGWQRS
jgi:hypothetical protein